MKIERIEQRFGFIAEKKEFIAVKQLVEALEIQAMENIERGEHRFIGDILYGLGYISRAQVNEVLKLIDELTRVLDNGPHRL